MFWSEIIITSFVYIWCLIAKLWFYWNGFDVCTNWIKLYIYFMKLFIKLWCSWNYQLNDYSKCCCVDSRTEGPPGEINEKGIFFHLGRLSDFIKMADCALKWCSVDICLPNFQNFAYNQFNFWQIKIILGICCSIINPNYG